MAKSIKEKESTSCVVLRHRTSLHKVPYDPSTWKLISKKTKAFNAKQGIRRVSSSTPFLFLICAGRGGDSKTV